VGPEQGGPQGCAGSRSGAGLEIVALARVEPECSAVVARDVDVAHASAALVIEIAVAAVNGLHPQVSRAHHHHSSSWSAREAAVCPGSGLSPSIGCNTVQGAAQRQDVFSAELQVDHSIASRKEPGRAWATPPTARKKTREERMDEAVASRDQPDAATRSPHRAPTARSGAVRPCSRGRGPARHR